MNTRMEELKYEWPLLYNSVEFKNVCQLKLMCKELGIRGYSGKRKSWIQNIIKKHSKQKEEKEMKKETGLFCYPDIIQIIYQYHDVDDIDLKRKNHLISVKKEYLRTPLHLRTTSSTRTGTRNFYIWILARTDFNRMSISNLKIWLKVLGYKQKSLTERQLRDMVIRYSTELRAL